MGFFFSLISEVSGDYQYYHVSDIRPESDLQTASLEARDGSTISLTLPVDSSQHLNKRRELEFDFNLTVR